MKCMKPKSLVLDTPLLSDFHLSHEEAYDFRVKEFCNFENLQLESSSLRSLLAMFPSCKSIKKLTVNSVKGTEVLETRKFSLEALFDVFPNVIYLNLGPGAWSEAEICFRKGGLEDRNAMKELTEIVAHLVVRDIEVTLSFIYSILDKCTNLSNMALLLHPKEDSRAASSLISRCTSYCPRVQWRWGMWKEGSKDTWDSVGIQFEIEKQGMEFRNSSSRNESAFFSPGQHWNMKFKDATTAAQAAAESAEQASMAA